MVNSKQREDLGDNPEIGKYRSSLPVPTNGLQGLQYIKEKRSVETEAYVIFFNSIFGI